MNTRHRLFNTLTAIAGLTLMLALPTWAPAATVTLVDDTFSDGTTTAGTDPLSLNWTRAVSTLSITTNDSVFNSNALTLSAGSFGVTAANLPSTVSLADLGDTITLAFDFHFTGTISNVAAAFRIGLMDYASDANGSAYYVTLGSGTNTSAYFWRNNVAAISGSDQTSLPLSGTYLGVNDKTNKHTASLSVTRTATGVDIVAIIDGATLTTSDASAAAITSFDGLRVGLGSSSPIGFSLDNVVVTYATAIPAPAALPAGLALLGGIGLSRRRR